MTITNTWDETHPSGSRDASNFDDDTRRMRVDFREQLTDGNHDNIQANPSTGARHVATDSDDEFPIYAADGTTKIAGQGTDTRNFGDGTRLDHIFELRVAVDGLAGATFQTVKIIALEDNSAYSIEARIVSRATTGSGHGALTQTACYFRAGAGAVELAESTSQDDSGATALTAQFIPSGNNVVLQVRNTSATNHNVVAFIRYFRAD